MNEQTIEFWKSEHYDCYFHYLNIAFNLQDVSHGMFYTHFHYLSDSVNGKQVSVIFYESDGYNTEHKMSFAIINGDDVLKSIDYVVTDDEINADKDKSFSILENYVNEITN